MKRIKRDTEIQLINKMRHNGSVAVWWLVKMRLFSSAQLYQVELMEFFGLLYNL